MRKPEMILFDYGQTLGNERTFDGVRGTEAVLQYATANPHGYTAAEIQARADGINQELGRYDPKRKHLFQVEVPNHMFTTYLYQSMGIQLSLGPAEIDRIFWDAASPAVPTPGIEAFLDYLKDHQIRTAVLSNITYCEDVVQERIDALLPGHCFEFLLATSAYMFRKPNPRIFELALEKSGLQPEEVWYVGDNYLCDVAGARDAGLFPVWYRGAMTQPAPADGTVLTVSHWEELKRFLQSCE